MRIPLSGALAGVALCLAAPPARADVSIINCYDEQRQLVQKQRNDQCRGRIVSDEEAEAIKAKRRAYVQRAFNGGGAGTRARRPGADDADKDRVRLRAVGSGFFVSGRGEVLTNYHVVSQCGRISVAPATGGEADATISAAQPGVDLAVLSTGMRSAGIARFGPASVPAPQTTVGVVGYPDQGLPPIRPLLTNAVTSGRRQVARGLDAMEIRGDVRPGNSGGPVLDPRGSVVGVVFAKVDTPSVFARTGEVVRDVGFAIPNGITKRFLSSYRVPYLSGAVGEPPVDLLTAASRFVVRVNCWN